MPQMNYKRVSTSAYVKFIDARINTKDSEDDHEVITIKTMNGNIQLFFSKKFLIGYIETIEPHGENTRQMKNYYIYNFKGDLNNG